MAAEPRCCPKCAAVLGEEAKFCGMCGTETDTAAGGSTRRRHLRDRHQAVPRILSLCGRRRPGGAGQRRRQPDAGLRGRDRFCDTQGTLGGPQAAPGHRAGGPCPGRRRRPDRRVVAPRRRRGVRLFVCSVAALPRCARERLARVPARHGATSCIIGAHEGRALLWGLRDAHAGLLRSGPETPGRDRIAPGPLAPDEVLRPLRAQGLHPVPRTRAPTSSRTTSATTTRPSPTTSC